MQVTELMKKVDMKPLNQIFDKEIVGGLVTDIVGDVMTLEQKGVIWVTTQTDKMVVAVANLMGIAAIVITQGRKVEKEVLQLADNAQITMFSTAKTSWGFIGELYALGIRISPY
jgi:predicted transcriptional regulator